MRYYLRATYRATIRTFQADTPEETDRTEAELERLDRGNKAILKKVYHGLEDGLYDYAYVRRNGQVSLYTRDTTGGSVRVTRFSTGNDGELIPETHHVFRDAEEMARIEIFTGGAYINVCAA